MSSKFKLDCCYTNLLANQKLLTIMGHPNDPGFKITLNSKLAQIWRFSKTKISTGYFVEIG